MESPKGHREKKLMGGRKKVCAFFTQCAFGAVNGSKIDTKLGLYTSPMEIYGVVFSHGPHI